MGILGLEGKVESQLIEIGEKIVKYCQQITNSKIASLWLLDEKTKELVLIPRFSTNNQGLTKQIKDRALVCYTFNTGEFVTTNDVRSEPCDESGPIYDTSTENKTRIKIRSLISVPLQAEEGKRVGVIQAMNICQGTYSPYHNSILQLLATIVSRCIYDATHHKKIIDPSVELEGIIRMTSELNHVEKLQESNFPQIPITKKFDVALEHLPCQLIGGDWYEFKHDKKGRLGVLIGDVASHGLGSAFVANSLLVKTRTLLDSQDFLQPIKMGDLLIQLNKDYPAEMYSTLAFAVFHPDGKMHYLSAGHPQPILYSPSGIYPDKQTDKGFPLGVVNQKRFASSLPKPSQYLLERGGGCVFYTDGVTEARSPDIKYEQFTKKRLVQTLTKNVTLSNKELLSSVNKALRLFSGAAHQKYDDALLAGIRRKL